MKRKWTLEDFLLAIQEKPGALDWIWLALAFALLLAIALCGG